MNKILKTTLIVLAGITFFGVNFFTTPVAKATSVGSFNAVPYAITSGQSVTFQWNSIEGNPLALGTTSCVIMGRGFPTGGFQGARSGTTPSITPTTTQTTPETVTYRILCTTTIAGAAVEVPGTKTYDLVIKPAGTAPVINITATPYTVPKGTTKVTLKWGVTNASSCTASGGWSGSKPPNSPPQGEEVPFSGSDTRYRLTCVGGPSGTETGTGYVQVTAAFAEPNFNNPDADFLAKFDCSIVPFRFSGCFPIAFYYSVYKPAGLLLNFAGLFFDITLTMSIDKAFIIQPFINSVWVIIRNFSNMIFIFILLYAGIQTMLSPLLGGDWRKTVLNVVVIALLINFSLFFTKVAIDAGNILAVGVYSSIGKAKDSAHSKLHGGIVERDLSTAVAAAFQPQAFTRKPPEEALDLVVMVLVATVVSCYAAYIFFKVGLIFIGRLLAFWFLLMISPFAFISITLPSKANIFNWWLDTLVSQTFMAPVFLFMLYIIMQVTSVGLLTGLIGSSTDGGPGGVVGGFIFDKLLVPAVIAALLLIALDKAAGLAKKMGGEFGAAASEYIGKALGTAASAAITVASGGAALGAGALGKAAMGSGALGKALNLAGNAESSSMFKRGFGKLGLLAADQAQKSTFDPRNIGGGIGKGISSLGLGKGNKTNYEDQTKKWREPQEKRQERISKLMELNPYELAKFQESELSAKGELGVAQQELGDLDKLVKLQEEALKQTPEAKALAAAEAAEAAEKERADNAAQKAAAAQAALEKARNNPNGLRNAATGKTFEEEGAEQAALAAAKDAKDAADAYGKAKTVLADAGSKYAVAPQAVELAQSKQKQADQRTIVEQKKAAHIIAKDAADKENQARHESYAQQVERGGFTAESRMRARARAQKIRDDTPAARKAKKDEEKLLGILAKQLKDADKDKPAASAPTPPPAPSTPTK